MNPNSQAQQLCERAKTGDTVAAGELLSLYYEPIYAFLRRLSGNNEDAEDLTQKTFARVWSALNTYQSRSAFSTWIHGIGYHIYVDWRRKANRLEARADEWWETCAAPGPDPFEDAAERESAHQVYALVERLNEDSREVIHLHYYQGLTLQETADVLGIAPSTVKYRLRAAIASVKSKSTETKTFAKPSKI